MDHRVWAEIDHAAIAANLARIRKRCEPAETLVVVKADAYGHGAVEVARTAVEGGAAFLGVGDSGEALELRRAGIAGPILILGSLIPGEMEPVIAHDVSITVHSSQKIRLLARFAEALRKRVRIHLKIDTGMGRLGALPSRTMELLAEAAASEHLELEGICTHLAATRADDPSLAQQVGLFREVCERAAKAGFRPPWRHAANSLGIFHAAGGLFTLARPGGAVYGILPGSPAEREANLSPAMTLKSQVVFLKDLPAGAPVGYGGTFTTGRPTRIAILPIGYNDGYRFAFSGRAQVLLRGHRAPVIGRVSMDYTTVDATDVEGLEVGDEAVLLGRQEGERISLGDLAGWAQTIPYEILCGIGKRVRRVHRRDPEPRAPSPDPKAQGPETRTPEPGARAPTLAPRAPIPEPRA